VNQARPAATEPAPAVLRTPQSPAELFKVFNRLALQGFGGVLPIAQRELVERERWLTQQQFVELLSISQVLPGPNIVNLSLMFGDRHFGWRGAAAALGGMMVTPLLLVLLLAALHAQFALHPLVAGALSGMGAVAAGLVVATAVKLAATLVHSPMGRPACMLFGALTFGAIAWLRWPLVWVVLGLGGPAIALAWRRLASQPGEAA
jgi:chromate transporter